MLISPNEGETAVHGYYCLGLIWMCAFVRYWPYRGVGTCASVLKLEWGIYMWLYIRHGDVVYVPFYPFY